MNQLAREQKRFIDKFGYILFVTVYNDNEVCVSAEGAVYLSEEQAKELAEFLQKSKTK